MLYTTKQIAEIYSGKAGNVTPYMITHTWITNGLKHIKGKGNSFLYKKEWVDEFLENKATIESMEKIKPEKAILYHNGKLDKKLIADLEYARKYNKVR